MALRLEDRLSALDLVEIPVWVFDLDKVQIPWANARALELWRASSRGELGARDLSDISETVQARLRRHLAAIREGGRFQEAWTFYPHGKPVTLTIHLSGVALDDDRLAILAQGMPGEQAFDADLVRGIEVLRHMPLAVILADRSGALLMQNPACFKAFGTSSSLLPWFADPEVGSALTSAVGAGEVFHAEALMRTASGERWHAIEARPTRDPVTGDAAILMFQLDVTARREAESTAHAKGRLAAELSSALSLAERQRSEILALSAPVLGVSERTLVLPLIGALDEERSALIAQRLLSAVSARGARCVILDLTGVSALDGPAAARLVRLARAVELLGAIPLLTGVTPPLARALADAGVDTGDLAFMGDLRQGVEASRAIEIEGGGSARGRGLDRQIGRARGRKTASEGRGR